MDIEVVMSDGTRADCVGIADVARLEGIHTSPPDLLTGYTRAISGPADEDAASRDGLPLQEALVEDHRVVRDERQGSDLVAPLYHAPVAQPEVADATDLSGSTYRALAVGV